MLYIIWSLYFAFPCVPVEMTPLFSHKELFVLLFPEFLCLVLSSRFVADAHNLFPRSPLLLAGWFPSTFPKDIFQFLPLIYIHLLSPLSVGFAIPIREKCVHCSSYGNGAKGS